MHLSFRNTQCLNFICRRNVSWTHFIVCLAWGMRTTCFEYSIFRRLMKCTRSSWVTVLCICNRFCHSGSEDEMHECREAFQNIFHRRCMRVLPSAFGLWADLWSYNLMEMLIIAWHNSDHGKVQVFPPKCRGGVSRCYIITAKIKGLL